MKFKLTLRDKIIGNIENSYVEAANEAEVREGIDDPNLQIVSIRPLRVIGEKPARPAKRVYIRTQALRNRMERDLCNRQMSIGKYSPEAKAAAVLREQAALQKQLAKAMA